MKQKNKHRISEFFLYGGAILTVYAGFYQIWLEPTPEKMGMAGIIGMILGGAGYWFYSIGEQTAQGKRGE